MLTGDVAASATFRSRSPTSVADYVRAG